jgi:hypothetical protein
VHKKGDTHFTNAGIARNLVTYDGGLDITARMYADGRDLKDPLTSPIRGDFQDFSPTYPLKGMRDLFLNDTALFPL